MIQEMIKDPTLHAGVLLSGKEADALSRGYQQTMLSRTVDQWVDQMQAALEQSPEKQAQSDLGPRFRVAARGSPPPRPRAGR